jgi:hypothetical protein
MYPVLLVAIELNLSPRCVPSLGDIIKVTCSLVTVGLGGWKDFQIKHCRILIHMIVSYKRALGSNE